MKQHSTWLVSAFFVYALIASVTAADKQVLGDYLNSIDTNGGSTSAGLRHADAGKQRL